MGRGGEEERKGGREGRWREEERGSRGRREGAGVCVCVCRKKGAGDCPGAGSRQALMKGEGACFSALCKLEGCWSVELGSCAAG